MKLKIKLILSSVILMALITGGSIYYFEKYSGDYLRNKIINDFEIVAEISEGSYFSFIESLKIRTINWGSDGKIRNNVKKILEIKDKSAKEKLVKELNVYLRKEKIKYDPSVIIIDVLDKNGIVIASTRDERLGVDEKAEEEKIGVHRFSKAINSGFDEAYITSIVYEEDEYPEPMINLVARIFSNEKDEAGGLKPLDAVLLIHFVDTHRLSDVLTGKRQTEKGALTGQAFYNQYKTAEIYIVNKDKLMITPSRFVEKAVLNLFVDTEPVRRCLEKAEEFKGEYLNYQGEKVIGASMCIKEENAILITEVQSAEIFKPLIQFNNYIILAGILILVLIGVGFFFLSDFLLNNLTAIVAVAKKVIDNDFSVRVDIKSKDEIGYLANVFNQMLDNIEKSQGELKKAEIKLRETNLSLENRIKERTAELMELKNNLERDVFNRTIELRKKMTELEKFKELTVGRELKMVELKEKIKKLEKHE